MLGGIGIAVLAGCGAVTRYALIELVEKSDAVSKLIAIIAINTFGCLLISLLIGSTDQQSELSLVVAAGFLGAFTSMSTLAQAIVEVKRAEGFWFAFGLCWLAALLGVVAFQLPNWLS